MIFTIIVIIVGFYEKGRILTQGFVNLLNQEKDNDNIAFLLKLMKLYENLKKLYGCTKSNKSII